MRLLALTILTLATLAAQPYPDADTLMRQSEAATGKLHSLQYNEEVTIETALGGQNMKITTEASRAIVNPGKMRSETKAQGLTMLIVSDGATTWMYNSMNNEYTRRTVAFGPQAIMDAMGMGGMMPNLADISLKQKTTGEETISIDGEKHDCWVVHSDIGDMPLPEAAKGAKITNAAMTTWVDKKLGIDLQSDVSMTLKMPGGAISTTTHIKSVKKNLLLNGPVADSLFTFTPPEGAKEVENLAILGGMGAPPEMAGKAAAAFSLTGVDGKPYGLAPLKGKPVLLDFWATWCVPCREATPAVEKLSAEFKAQGLTVLGVDAGEDRDTVEAFLKKTPLAYPAVLSGASEILKDYKITGYPTFVLIGADGNVAAYEMGFGGEEALRRMLEKAGLGKK